MTPARSIVLIGMMGAGKTSVGRCLERQTGLPRFDIDDMVSERMGKSIASIFADLGETEFRQAESEVLATLQAAKPAIVVTGGGIVLREENVCRLKRLGVVVWLDADEEVLFERASRRSDRPLLQTENPRATLSKISSDRRNLYEGAADIRIDTTNHGDDEVAHLIMREIKARTAGTI